MATPIHGCVSLPFCSEVKLGWNSWKWELLNLENMEDPNNKEKINCWWLKGTPSNNLTVCCSKKKSLLDMRHRERRRGGGDCRGWWRKNPCNTSQCFYGRFLIETSFTDNKHAISLYKPTPQISVTHSSPDTLSRISQQHTHARTHTHFQMLYRDKHALTSFALWHTRKHSYSRTHSHIYKSQWMMGKNDAGRRITLFSRSDQRWEWQHSSSDSECVSDWGGIRSEMMTVRMWVENETFYQHPKICAAGGRRGWAPLSV